MRNVSLATIACTTLLALSTAGRAGDQKSILYIVPSLDDEYYVTQVDAAKNQALKYPEYTFEFTAAGGSRAPVPELIAKIEAGVTRGIDVIVIDAGESGDLVAPALAKAIDTGVKVVAHAADIPSLKNPSASTGYDQRAGAKPAGEFMAGHLKPGSKIVVIRCAIGNTHLDAREAGFMDGIEGKGIEVVDRGEANCDPLQARALMENWITAHPEIDGVFSDTDIALVGAVEALRIAKLDPVVVGHDGQKPILKLLSEGDIVDATVLLPTVAIGQLGVDVAVGVLQGKSYSDRVILPPQGMITRENVQDYLPNQ